MDWIQLIEIFFTTAGTALLGFLLGRRKYNTEVKSNVIRNFDAELKSYKDLFEGREEIYKSMVDSLNKRVDELTEENKELRNQVLTVSNFITNYIIQNGHDSQVDFTPIANLIKK